MDPYPEYDDKTVPWSEMEGAVMMHDATVQSRVFEVPTMSDTPITSTVASKTVLAAVTVHASALSVPMGHAASLRPRNSAWLGLVVRLSGG